jgi:hypothetical protein
MKARMLVFSLGIVSAAAIQPASAQPEAQSPTMTTAKCDSVSFSTGTPENRAVCRRVYSHQMRRNGDQVPQWAIDYEW